ncbi:MAG: cytochrome c [Ignavibacteria bacterium]|nr:cytochrome c [Ignavibacteria bacterium]
MYDYFRDLEKFYGILYILFLVYVVFLGVKYVKTLDYNKLYSAPGLLAADTNMRVTQPVKRGNMTPPVDVMLYSVPSPDLIAKGKDLYNTNCASCHGEAGLGNGAAGAALNPPPRNFVNPQIWKNGPTIANMYVTLQEGIPNTGMASFSNISPEDRFAIIHYVHTFNPTYPKDNPDSLKALDVRYSLATGVKAANQIPLDLAMELQVLNSDTLSHNLNEIAYQIRNSRMDSSASILRSIILNENKALHSLASNLKWNESPEEFVKFLETDPVDKGFKATVYQLSADESGKVYMYLKNLYVKNKG